jgi:hypothetical protein
MSLWWARKEQLDNDQMALIEGLSLSQNHLILGPPGSGKTNVLSAPRPICKKPRATKCMTVAEALLLSERPIGQLRIAACFATQTTLSKQLGSRRDSQMESYARS